MGFYQLDVEAQVADVARLIDWVETCSGRDGLAQDLTYVVMLAVEEAVMNVIGYAFADRPPPHSITVRLNIDPAKIVAEVTDNGREFNPTAMPEPDLTLPLERRRVGGLGIHLMRTMMDRLDYRRSDGRNILRLEKARR